MKVGRSLLAKMSRFGMSTSQDGYSMADVFEVKKEIPDKPQDFQ
jgi:hypothetical protein